MTPRLVQMLSRHGYPLIQLEAAWSLTNMACGEAHHTRVLVDSGVIRGVLDVFYNCGDMTVREQALWTLANMSSDIYCSQQILATGAVDPLLWMLDIKAPAGSSVPFPSLSTMQRSATIFANLCRTKCGASHAVQSDLLFAFAELLHSPVNRIR